MTANARRFAHEGGQTEDGLPELAGLPVSVYPCSTRRESELTARKPGAIPSFLARVRVHVHPSEQS